MEDTVVLGVHLDALTVSVPKAFRFPENWAEELRALKREMQELGDLSSSREVLEVDGVPGGPFKLSPTRHGHYQFRFANGRFYVEGRVWDNLPALIVQAKAELLYEYPGVDPFETFCQRIAVELLRVGRDGAEGMHLLPSRIDVAVDFQCEGFGIPERKDIVTDARKVDYNYEGLEPVTVTMGKRTNPVQVQLYDKTREVKISSKEWMLDVFEASGQFRESLAVWRLETRMRRAYLNDAGINGMASLKDRLPMAFATIVNDRNSSWVRFLDPVSDGQSNRRPPAGWFSQIMSTLRQDCGDWFSEELVKRKTRHSRASLDISIRRAGEYVARVEAMRRKVGMKATESSEEAFEYVRSRFEVMVARERSSWKEQITQQRRKLPEIIDPSVEAVRPD